MINSKQLALDTKTSLTALALWIDQGRRAIWRVWQRISTPR
jgi:hypothetical protein